MNTTKLLLIVLVFFTSQISYTQPYLNLDFEKIWNGKPQLWAMGGEGYDIHSDSTIFISGNKSLCFNDTSGKGISCIGRSSVPIEDVRGKKIKFTGYIKTDSITYGYAGLWWRADGASGILNFDNMSDRGARGSTGWKQYTIEMTIDSNATVIYFGVLIAGPGKAWFDNLQIEVDGIIYQQVPPQDIKLSSEQKDWLNNNTVEFETAEPNHNNADLQYLKSLIGSSRIVSLGEGTHGTSEFFKMKHRITKFLAEEMGFTVFAIEANMPEAQLINDYVLNGTGNAKSALAGLHFWTWYTQEVLDMIEWMREFNASGKGRIEFLGFDMQFPGIAADNVKKYLNKYDPVYLKEIEENYSKTAAAIMEIEKTNSAANSKLLDTCFSFVDGVYNYMLDKKSLWEKESDIKETELALRNARIVRQSIEGHMPNRATRDSCMAENVEWILNKYPDSVKIVLWAHNGHISKLTQSGMKPMGKYLDNRYSKEMFVMGFLFGEGNYTAIGKNGLGQYSTSLPQPGSMEYTLRGTGKDRLIIDLRKIKDSSLSPLFKYGMLERSIGAKAMDDAFFQTKVPDEYDALIYFDKTTPSACFGKPGVK